MQTNFALLDALNFLEHNLKKKCNKFNKNEPYFVKIDLYNAKRATFLFVFYLLFHLGQ